jgi:hypothetical protein
VPRLGSWSMMIEARVGEDVISQLPCRCARCGPTFNQAWTG